MITLSPLPDCCGAVVFSNFGKPPYDVNALEAELRGLVNQVRTAPFMLCMLNDKQDVSELARIISKIGFRWVMARPNYVGRLHMYLNDEEYMTRYFDQLK